MPRRKAQAMTPSERARLRWKLRQSYVGPLLVALALYAGVGSFVVAIQLPAAHMLSHAVNLLLPHLFPDAFPVTVQWLAWQAVVAGLVTGFFFAGIGLLFANWLYKDGLRPSSESP